jgi:hypothetical protein
MRVIERADSNVAGMRLVEVPAIEIAGHPVGPLWFVERPTANVHELAPQWMDRPVDGAVGGGLLRFLGVTLDCPGAAQLIVRTSTK